MSVGSVPRVSYVVGTYPQLTTTFIDREIAALREKGADIAIVSIRPPHGPLSPEQEPIRSRVRYLLPARARDVARAFAFWLLRRPFALLAESVWLLTRPHHDASRMRSLAYISAGLCAAYRLRDRRGVHVHAHFVDRAATVAAIAARLLGTTYSATAHANDIYREPFMLGEKVGRATFVATCTEYNRAHLAGEVRPGDVSKVICLYHGLDLGRYRPAAGERADPPTLLAVAQLKEKKGLRYLVEACAQLRDAGVAIRCEIVGDGPLRPELAAQIDELGVGDCVVLHGALPHEEVLERYRAATAFVLPSVVAADGDRDGIPNVILEAMAMELPVISTPVSGIPEAVRDGDTGMLVQPHDSTGLVDAITRLLADPDRARQLGRNGRRLVADRFDVTANAERLLEQFGPMRAGTDGGDR
jgi:glycosyltransferase involved in cell wall biosynthesis